ncbi:glycosyl transferase family 4 [Motilibacter peucedani]|uniref:Glycosyl transferase family 4 n=1 Tax=Motilibacter peucedani TaxID=598650 RepID=A0A420XTK2_9ACTN|nr:glycosyltransferase [Motilibacter peucedani]RKS80163.1 glycosyl transferase family 4 [Motilibacter peucedani]
MAKSSLLTVCVVLPPSPTPSPALQQVKRHAKRLARGRVRVLLVEPVVDAVAAAECPSAPGVWRVPLPYDSGALPAYGDTLFETALAELLLREQADVVHLHWSGATTVVPAVERCWLVGVPAIVSIHDDWAPAADAPALTSPVQVVRQMLTMASLVCSPDPATAQRASVANWAPDVRHLSHASGSAPRWEDAYRELAALDEDHSRDRTTLSAVVTTYQRNEELAACLDSLVAQTLPRERFEVVVIDDCSEPSAEPVVRGYEDRLDVTYVRMERNVGIGEARNAGIDASRNDVLAFLDDDDVLAPRYLEELLATYDDGTGEVDAVLAWTGASPRAAASPAGVMAFRGGLYMNYTSFHEGQDLEWGFWWGGRCSIRRTRLGEHRFNVRFCEDTELAYRITQDETLTVRHTRRAVQRVDQGLEPMTLVRRHGRLGQAQAQLAELHPQLVENHPWFQDSTRVRALQSGLPLRPAMNARIATDVTATLELPALRACASGATSLLDLVGHSYGMLGSVENGLGWFAARRAAQARADGRRLRLGIDVASPLLPAFLDWARTAPDEAFPELVLAVPGPGARAAYDTVRALAQEKGGTARLTMERGAAFWAGVDAVLDHRAPEGWTIADGLPLPRGPLDEALNRLFLTDSLLGSFR